MKVNNTGIDQSLKGIDSSKNKQGLGKGADSSEKPTTSEIDSASRVDVSERAQLMNKATEIAKNAEHNSSDKIARLQKMIDEGSYKVDAEAVADRLVDEYIKTPDV